jgi:hypothetical protein
MNLMNKIELLTILALTISCSGTKTTKNNNWVNFKYHHATAYFTETPLIDDVFIKNGKLNTTVTDTIGVTLSSEKIQALNQILIAPDPERLYPIMECFHPRHGVVFWSKDQKPIAWISVCFECRQMIANPEIIKYDLTDLKSFFEECGFPVYENEAEY